MKIVVLDESKKRKQQIAERLEQKGYDVVSCSATSEFMDAIETVTPDRIVMDVESWNHGRAIYNYFKFARKLADIPVLFFNASEKFSVIVDRAQHQDDKIFHKHFDVDELVLSVE